VLLVLAVATAASADGLPRLRIDTSLYPYLDRVKNDTDLSVAINARLPARFSYFSYINVRGVLSSEDADFVRSEQNLRWALSESLPVDLAYQAIFVEDNALNFSQLGLSLRLNDTPGLEGFFDRINLIYRFTVYLKRFSSNDAGGWQMEHSFKMRFPGVSERLYLSGFFDQTFDLNLPDSFPESPIVAEVQGGVRFWKDFYFVTEYRLNEFRLGKEHNLAAGIEYKFTWR
jgi:hypothetical protein